MGAANCRQVAHDRDEWRKAPREALILFGQCNHNKRKETDDDCVKTHLNHNIGAYPVTWFLKHTHYGSTDVICEPQKASHHSMILMYAESMELPLSKSAGLQVASESMNR